MYQYESDVLYMVPIFLPKQILWERAIVHSCFSWVRAWYKKEVFYILHNKVRPSYDPSRAIFSFFKFDIASADIAEIQLMLY